MTAKILRLSDYRHSDADLPVIDLLTAVDVAIRDLDEIVSRWGSEDARRKRYSVGSCSDRPIRPQSDRLSLRHLLLREQRSCRWSLCEVGFEHSQTGMERLHFLLRSFHEDLFLRLLLISRFCSSISPCTRLISAAIWFGRSFIGLATKALLRSSRPAQRDADHLGRLSALAHRARCFELLVGLHVVSQF